VDQTPGPRCGRWLVRPQLGARSGQFPSCSLGTGTAAAGHAGATRVVALEGTWCGGRGLHLSDLSPESPSGLRRRGHVGSLREERTSGESCLPRILCDSLPCKPGEGFGPGRASGLHHLGTIGPDSQCPSWPSRVRGALRSPPVTCVPSELSSAFRWPPGRASSFPAALQITSEWLAPFCLLTPALGLLGSGSLRWASYPSLPALCKEPRTCSSAELPRGWTSAPAELRGRGRGGTSVPSPSSESSHRTAPDLWWGQMRSECVP